MAGKKVKNDKIKIVIFVLVLLLSLSIGLYFAINNAIKAKKTSASDTTTTTTQEETESAIEEITLTQGDLKLAVQNLITNLNEMQEELDKLNTANAELRESNYTLNSAKYSLQTELNYANTNIATLKESLNNVKLAYQDIVAYYEDIAVEQRNNLTNIQNQFDSLYSRFIVLEQDNTTIDIEVNTNNNLKFNATANSLINNSIGKVTIPNCELKLNSNIKVLVNNQLLTNYEIKDRCLTAYNNDIKVKFYYYSDKIDTFAFENINENETYTIEFKQIDNNELNIVRWNFDETEYYCYINNNTINLKVVALDRLLEDDTIVSVREQINENAPEYAELTKELNAEIYLNGMLLGTTNRLYYNVGFDPETASYLYPHGYLFSYISDENLTFFDSNIDISENVISNGIYNGKANVALTHNIETHNNYRYKLNGNLLTVNVEWQYETYTIN